MTRYNATQFMLKVRDEICTLIDANSLTMICDSLYGIVYFDKSIYQLSDLKNKDTVYLFTNLEQSYIGHTKDVIRRCHEHLCTTIKRFNSESEIFYFKPYMAFDKSEDARNTEYVLNLVATKNLDKEHKIIINNIN